MAPNQCFAVGALGSPWRHSRESKCNTATLRHQHDSHIYSNRGYADWRIRFNSKLIFFCLCGRQHQFSLRQQKNRTGRYSTFLLCTCRFFFVNSSSSLLDNARNFRRLFTKNLAQAGMNYFEAMVITLMVVKLFLLRADSTTQGGDGFQRRVSAMLFEKQLKARYIQEKE